MIISIHTESKLLMERFLVLNPPVAIVAKEWFIASKNSFQPTSTLMSLIM